MTEDAVTDISYTSSVHPLASDRQGGPLIDYDVMSPRCPSRTVLRHVVDRWAPLVVIALHDGPLRFSELRRRIGGVTPKVLTQTLRSMERDGLLERTEAGGVPPRVDYELTLLGATLRGPMAALRAWAQDHADQVLAAREAYDAGGEVPPQAAASASRGGPGRASAGGGASGTVADAGGRATQAVTVPTGGSASGQGPQVAREAHSAGDAS